MAVICPKCADDGKRSEMVSNRHKRDRVKLPGDRFPDDGPLRAGSQSWPPPAVPMRCPECGHEERDQQGWAPPRYTLLSTAETVLK